LDNATGVCSRWWAVAISSITNTIALLQARRPAGTAMTPFVFAAAFEKGMFPGISGEDSALDTAPS